MRSRLRRKKRDMHQSAEAFVESVSETFELQGPIFEFGFRGDRDSPQTEPHGSEPFPETGYLDCDPDRQTEVDWLPDITRLPFADGAARTVMCVNTLQHVFEPPRAVGELVRILAPGGLLFVCTSTDPKQPQQPDDYWQPTPRAVQRLLAGMEATLVGWQGADESPRAVYGIGCKGPVGETFAAEAARFPDILQNRLDEAASKERWSARLKRLIAGWSFRRARRRAAGDCHKVRFTLHLPVGQHLTHHLLGSCLTDGKAGTRLDLSQ